MVITCTIAAVTSAMSPALADGWTSAKRRNPRAQAATLEFIEKGLTERIGEARRGIEAVEFTDRSAESVGAGLVAMLPRCRDIAILTDGVGGEDEDPEGLNLGRFTPKKGKM